MIFPPLFLEGPWVFFLIVMNLMVLSYYKMVLCIDRIVAYLGVALDL